jgi:hypothetical protein
VKGILVFVEAALFAGRRLNEDLGRSVDVGRGLLPCWRAHRRQRMSFDAEEGNAVGMRIQKHMHPTRGLKMPLTLRGRVLHSVQRPVHVNRRSTSLAQANEGGALESVSRSGKPAQAGGTGTGIETSGRSAARRGSPLPQGSSVIRQNRKGVVAPVPARIVSSGSCPHVVMQVAEVGRRRLVSNKLGKRAPKRADRVE